MNDRHNPSTRAVCNDVVAGDRLVQTFRARDTAFGYVAQNDVHKYIVAAFKVRIQKGWVP